MTKILLPLGMDLYIFTASIHKGNAKTIGMGLAYKGKIKDQIQALIIMREILEWKVDIITF